MSERSVPRPVPQAELFPSITEVLDAPEDRRLEDLSPVGCGVCMDSGFVFLGIVGDDGVETSEAIPCHRCGKGE